MKMIDIVSVKREIRNGNIKIYKENGNIYMENTDGERIVLMYKDGGNNG